MALGYSTYCWEGSLLWGCRCDVTNHLLLSVECIDDKRQAKWRPNPVHVILFLLWYVNLKFNKHQSSWASLSVSQRSIFIVFPFVIYVETLTVNAVIYGIKMPLFFITLSFFLTSLYLKKTFLVVIDWINVNSVITVHLTCPQFSLSNPNSARSPLPSSLSGADWCCERAHESPDISISASSLCCSLLVLSLCAVSLDSIE